MIQGTRMRLTNQSMLEAQIKSAQFSSQIGAQLLVYPSHESDIIPYGCGGATARCCVLLRGLFYGVASMEVDIVLKEYHCTASRDAWSHDAESTNS